MPQHPLAPCWRGALLLAVLAFLGPGDVGAQRTGSIAVTATVVAAPAARVSARLVTTALKESPYSRMRRRDGLVWIDADAPRGGRRRITINHLAN